MSGTDDGLWDSGIRMMVEQGSGASPMLRKNPKFQPFHAGIALSALMLVLALSRAVSYDVAIAVIQTMLGVAPLAGIIENRKNKSGWSLNTTATVSAGLVSIGIMMFIVGLPVTGASVLLSAGMWGLLAFQAFIYGGG